MRPYMVIMGVESRVMRPYMVIMGVESRVMRPYMVIMGVESRVMRPYMVIMGVEPPLDSLANIPILSKIQSPHPDGLSDPASNDPFSDTLRIQPEGGKDKYQMRENDSWRQ